MDPVRVRDRGDPRARYADAPHGTNAKYSLGGCRCPECRAAATAARRARREGRGILVDAKKARHWLQFLRYKGIGIRTIVDSTSLTFKSVQQIRAGTVRRITRATEEQILKTTDAARAPGAIEPAKRAQWYLRILREEGFTWSEIATGIGWKGKRAGGVVSALRWAQQVKVSTRVKLERFYRRRVEDPSSADKRGRTQ